MTRASVTLRSRLRDDAGFAMAAVVLMTAVLSLLAVTTIDLVTSEHGRSDVTRTRDTAFEAAEAGMNDYLAKLTDDKIYYLHHVHPGESTRRPVSGADVDPQTTQCVEASGAATRAETGVLWPSAAGTTWTYPNGKDNWCQLADGYEYNLQITPPSVGNNNIQIVSTGRKIGDTNSTHWRALEQWTHFSLVSEFQMIANADIAYGSTASTYGKIYTGIDSSGVAHSVNHAGTAYASIYAEGSITGSPSMQNGAQKYQGRAAVAAAGIKSPIDFANFQMSLDDITRAADSGGLHLNSSGAVWRLVFLADGTFTVQPCTAGCTNPAGATQPTWGSAVPGSPFTVPQNGAIFSDVSVVVSGVVNGRVTVASNDDIIVGADISYQTLGDDVLGLIGKNEVLVAQWCPNNLNWRAGTIAQNGQWRSYTGTTSKGTMNFYGSTATNNGGYMSMFATRNYNYDTTLLYLPPPWFPTVNDAYQVAMFREVKP